MERPRPHDADARTIDHRPPEDGAQPGAHRVRPAPPLPLRRLSRPGTLRTAPSLLALLALVAGLLVGGGASPAQAQDVTRGFFWANAWANHHTARPGGDGRHAMAGARRMARMVRLIDRRNADVGVIVEMELPQVRAFARAGGGRYAMVTGGTRRIRDGVFYDTSAYRLVSSYHFLSWTKHGRRAKVPVVFLEDLANGRRLAVMGVHHAAFGAGARWREKALDREIAEIKRLKAAHGSGLSVFIAGDFNSIDRAYCRMRKAGMRSPVPPAKRCHHTPVSIDQLFGDRTVTFRHYRRIVQHTNLLTDHAAVYFARFTVPSISEGTAAARR